MAIRLLDMLTVSHVLTVGVQPMQTVLEVRSYIFNWYKADPGKGSHDLFDETGIFLSVCRHGIIWFIIDMIKSGELYVMVHVPIEF